MNANDISRLIVIADSARAIVDESRHTRLCAAIHELRKARVGGYDEARYRVEIAYWALFDKWPAF